jgi:hypothetical protein
MFSFKTAVNSLEDVPEEWIYKHYLKISQPLDGRYIRIKSIYSDDDRTPSMFLYYKDGRYKFKDFSSGASGDCYNIVNYLTYKNTGKHLTYPEMANKVVADYKKYVSEHGSYDPCKIEAEAILYEWGLDYSPRSFNALDAGFWSQKYGITRDTLSKHDVFALRKYQLIKNYKDGTKKVYKPVEDDFIYGYASKSMDIHTIYQPYNRDLKFLKLKSVIYGEAQLEYKSPLLIIGSSLKDILAMKELKLKNVEYIAPPSENSYIKANKIEELQSYFPYILTLFDNDEAGVRSMKKYKELYNIDYLYCQYEKDMADFVYASGQDEVRKWLTINIQKKINQ